MCSSAMQCVTVNVAECCSVLQCVAVCCSVLQCVAVVYCSVSQCSVEGMRCTERVCCDDISRHPGFDFMRVCVHIYKYKYICMYTYIHEYIHFYDDNNV